MNVDEALTVADAADYEVASKGEIEAIKVLAVEVRKLHVAGDALMAVARSLAYAWETDTPDRVMWDEWKKVGPAIKSWVDAR